MKKREVVRLLSRSRQECSTDHGLLCVLIHFTEILSIEIEEMREGQRWPQEMP